jgi:hypothetical protein
LIFIFFIMGMVVVVAIMLEKHAKKEKNNVLEK